MVAMNELKRNVSVCRGHELANARQVCAITGMQIHKPPDSQYMWSLFQSIYTLQSPLAAVSLTHTFDTFSCPNNFTHVNALLPSL